MAQYSISFKPKMGQLDGQGQTAEPSEGFLPVVPTIGFPILERS